MRLSRLHRRWIYAVCATLAGSGIAWLIAHYLLSSASPFDDAHHPSEPWWLRLHGAAAMAFLVVLGTILPGHAKRAWSLRRNCTPQVRRNIITGILMLTLVTALVSTGYALYYSGSEELRPYISTCHWIAGLVAAAGFYQHRRGRLQRGSQRAPAKPAQTQQTPALTAAGGLLRHHPRRHL